MFKHNQLIFPSMVEQDARFFVIAGFSLNGPVGTPFMIKDGVEPSAILGDGKLLENYHMAREYGVKPLLFRLNGSHGECTVTHEGLNVPIMRFTTLEATDESNNIQIHAFPTHFIIEGLNTQHSYYLADYKNVFELAIAIKNNLYYSGGEVDVEILKNTSLVSLFNEEKYLPFNGADDGFNEVSIDDESDSDEKVQAQLDLLQEQLLDEDSIFTGELSSFNIDTLLFTDVAYERDPERLTSILGKFAKTKTDEQIIFCSVVLTSNYFKNSRWDEEEDTYAPMIEDLLSKTPIHEQEHMKHVEVVIGYQNSFLTGQQLTPCASSYALMRHTLPQLLTSSTNKALPAMNVLSSEELKQYEVANLSGSGYICIVPSIKNGFVPYSSKNLYLPHLQRSPFSKPHYLRSVHGDIKKIANYLNQYIGEPFNLQLLKSITQEVQNFLDILLEDHPIYRNITLETLDYSLNSASFGLEFQLYGEIETVRSSLEYSTQNEVNVEWL